MDVMAEFVNVIVTGATRIRLAADSHQASRSGCTERLLLSNVMLGESDNSQLRQVWTQKSIPVVFRRGQGERLILRLPYTPENREWVKAR